MKPGAGCRITPSNWQVAGLKRKESKLTPLLGQIASRARLKQGTVSPRLRWSEPTRRSHQNQLSKQSPLSARSHVPRFLLRLHLLGRGCLWGLGPERARNRVSYISRSEALVQPGLQLRGHETIIAHLRDVQLLSVALFSYVLYSYYVLFSSYSLVSLRKTETSMAPRSKGSTAGWCPQPTRRCW